MLAKNNSEEVVLSKKHRQRGKNKKIGFCQEIITKDTAKKLLNQEKDKHLFIPEANIASKQSSSIESSKDSKFAKRKIEELDTPEKKTKRKRKTKSSSENQKSNTETESLSDETQNCTTDATEEKTDKELSKRALKKIKHQKLLEEKKNKVDSVLKQKALNYLSKWKHDNTNWKFEKLRQIWLLQNMYDQNKIEDKFWNTLVEYFSNSKGKTHEAILKKAIEIVEKESDVCEDVKLKRARDIVQNLQE